MALNAALNSGGGGETSATFDRPGGSSGDGFNLQDKMGLNDNRDKYKAIQVRTLTFIYISAMLRRTLAYDSHIGPQCST
jgi:hypothetical protein